MAATKIRRPNRSPQTLRRYTRLSVLLDTLVNQRITLISPELWEDRNDTLQLQRYRNIQGLNFVGALCLTGAAETFHHWKVYAGGIDGVCIEFNKEELERYIKPHSQIIMKKVKYVKVSDIADSQRYPLKDLPFYKRWGFAAEEEVRVICSTNDEIDHYDIPIDLSCIKRIVTSPFLPEPLLDGITSAIQAIDCCSVVKVDKSRLIQSSTWKKGWERRIKRA